MVDAGCLEPDALLAWVGGGMSDAARTAALGHIEGCVACRQAVSALARLESIGDRDEAAAPPPPRGAAPEVAIGERLGRFRVTRVLGRGGMGIVVAARDEVLDRDVAIKVIRPELAATAALETRLVREAQVLAALRHPNLVSVLEVGEVDGWPFLVMELVDGSSLRRWIDTGPSWRDAIARCAAAGRGLAALHAAGYLHRDVKPDNVIIALDGRVVLADLGLAKRIESVDVPAVDPALTRPGAVVGTPRYLAPERVAGLPGDVRADIYAFCAMTLEAARARGTDGVPARLRVALSRGVDPDPAARYGSMTEVLAVLDRALARRRGAIAIAGGAIAAAAAVGVWWIAAGGERGERAPVVATTPTAADAAPVAPVAADAAPPTPIAIAPADAPPAPAPSSRRDAAAPASGSAAPVTSFERTLSIEYLRELGRAPATAAYAEARVMRHRSSSRYCNATGTDVPFGIDWGRVERKGLVELTVDGTARTFLLYQVQGQHRRYLFDAYNTEVYLDVAVGTEVVVCPGPADDRALTAPKGWAGDFVVMNAFGGPVAGAPPILSRTPRPSYLRSGPTMSDGSWAHGDGPVLFVVAAAPRSVLDTGRRDMGIYFLDAPGALATALDRADHDAPAWVVARFTELQVKNGTSYPALRVDDVVTGLFAPP